MEAKWQPKWTPKLKKQLGEATLERSTTEEELHAAAASLRAVSANNLSVNDLSRLELAYNSCVDMMLRYFTRRIELVRLMFGTDTLRESWDIERSRIQGARLRLLVARRETMGSVTT